MATEIPDHDPFLVLRQPIAAVAPSETFAAELRRSISSALGRPPEPEPEPEPTTETIDLGRRRAMPAPNPTTTSQSGAPTDTPIVAQFTMPSLVVNGGHAAVAFYQEIFGATVSMEAFVEPDGRIGHIELDIGGAMIGLSDEYPEHDIRGPAALGGTPVTMAIRVPTPADVDVLCERAVARGATMVFPVADQFYGERSGRIRDPWGHEWRVTATIEDLTVAEMQERFTAEQAAPADTD